MGCNGSEPPPESAAESPSEPASSAQSKARSYSARSFFETTAYFLSGNNAWSADGSKLLIGSNETGTFNVYALAADGAGKEPMTSSTESAHRPISWFPDDDRILYTADSGGNELNHVYVRESSGEVRDLTPGDSLKAMFGGWAGDKQKFFILTNERDPGAFDLYEYSVADYSRRLIFENNESWMPAGGTRDGRYLALMRVNSSADNDIFLLDLDQESAEPVHITPHEGDISYGVYEFTPDDRSLVFATNEHGEFVQAWTYDLASGETQPLIEADWDVSFVFFSESGRYRMSGINEDARIRISILDTESGENVELAGLPDGNLAQIRFSPDEEHVALMVSTDTSPNDIYVVDRHRGDAKRLTNAPNPEIDESDLVASEVVRYPSFDGLEIPGILYRPQGASAEAPVPALVWVHGGPGGQSGRGYSATLQHLANHGYAILAANNRGSSGYGKTFFHMDDQKHGEVDLDDIVHAQKYLAGLDWVDESRIGIIGGSYGGYMVGAALAFRPDVFKVGVNIFGVMNWLRTLESIPPWWEAQRKSLYDELGDPATDADRLRRISPLFHAENISVPLLVVQGANDPRVLQVESDEIVAAVRKNEVPVEYIVFENEGHGFSQTENRITASDAFVSFLDMHL